MIGKKVKITDVKLSKHYGKEFYILWNIPKSTKTGVTTYNFTKLEPGKPSKLWALGQKPNQAIADTYAGESQFTLI